MLTICKVSAISILNSVQAYSTLTYTARVYSENPSPQAAAKKNDDAHPTSTANPLTSRIFGTWTVIQSMVRLYAAYHITNPELYQMAFLTYSIAFAHFMGEWFIFKTVKWGAPIAGPVLISTSSLLWMWLQWDYYVQ